jgi:hypothetical protein
MLYEGWISYQADKIIIHTFIHWLSIYKSLDGAYLAFVQPPMQLTSNLFFSISFKNIKAQNNEEHLIDFKRITWKNKTL